MHSVKRLTTGPCWWRLRRLCDQIYARDVCARSIEAGDKTDFDWIGRTGCSESRIAETMLLSRYAQGDWDGGMFPLVPEVLDAAGCGKRVTLLGKC
jgi:hypothetical protein